MTDRYADDRARFTADTKDHALTVLHDDGLYRHLRFKAPGTSFYHFDLVTWPWHLSFGGDMDGYVFARDEDMFRFFRSGHGINPGYWAEKVVAGEDRVKVYSEAVFRQLVTERFVDTVRDGEAPPGLGRAIRADIFDDPYGELADEAAARGRLNQFECKGFRFTDTWKWNLTEFNWSFLWACHAIQWGIGQYDAAKATCSTCEGTRSLHCAAHVAGDGCVDMELACPDCAPAGKLVTV